ncbi:MAG: hypothetical protein ACRELX_09635 [Longimicrobiales bacterium]
MMAIRTGPTHVFVLSPASCTGRRAKLLMREAADFALARRVRAGEATLGEVFSFLSGLYFRGKLTYAESFARPPADTAGVHVVTPTRGLMCAGVTVTLADLREFAGVDIGTDNAAYRDPLDRSARALAAVLPAETAVVLLGSIATGKYTDGLGAVFGDRLLFPADFAGRGDMSRGGLLLRCVEERRELRYVPVDGSPRRGRRPPKLVPRRVRNAAP